MDLGKLFRLFANHTSTTAVSHRTQLLKSPPLPRSLASTAVTLILRHCEGRLFVHRVDGRPESPLRRHFDSSSIHPSAITMFWPAFITKPPHFRPPGVQLRRSRSPLLVYAPLPTLTAIPTACGSSSLNRQIHIILHQVARSSGPCRVSSPVLSLVDCLPSALRPCHRIHLSLTLTAPPLDPPPRYRPLVPSSVKTLALPRFRTVAPRVASPPPLVAQFCRRHYGD